MIAVLGALLWLARPQFLPPGSGSDLTHHLMLVDYIERQGHLVHDRGLSAVLGEMADYTAGFHLLAVLAGVWSGTDGLHASYVVVALTVALKAGFVFLIARRDIPRDVASLPFSIAAVLLLFLPRPYFLGSFADYSYFAQVASELFAVGMWWAAVIWTDRPSLTAAAFFGLTGAAAFLTWPVWIGPMVIVWTLVTLSSPSVISLASLAIGLVPPILVAIIHTAGHAGASAIAGTSGFAIWPSPATVGWTFLIVSIAGTIAAARDRGAGIPLLLLAAIVLQAAGLAALARMRGAETPYLALKMGYLAIYPLAVAAAVGAHQMLARVVPRRRVLIASAAAVGLGVFVTRDIATTPRPRSPVSNAARDAGLWARANVPIGCVDYLVEDDDTAYWLHLAVLGNPRDSQRSRDPDSFEPTRALVRWVLPGGLPYAIARDLEALPADIRTNVDVLQRFGSAAVVRRRGESTCTDDSRRDRGAR